MFRGSLLGKQSSRSKAQLSKTTLNVRSMSVSQIESEDDDDDGPCHLRKALCFFRANKTTVFTPSELETKVIKLHRFCLTHNPDSYKVHLFRLKGLNYLEEIIARADPDYFQQNHIVRIIWSAISCTHHFYMRLKNFRGSMEWIRRRQAKRALKVFENVLVLLLPIKCDLVIESMFTFYTEGRIWDSECLCADLIQILLANMKSSGEAVHLILNLIDTTCLNDTKTAKQIIKVLYDVLEFYRWPTISETLIIRLLDMYHASMVPDESENRCYLPLRKGLEVCVRHVMQNLSNSSLRIMLIFRAERDTHHPNQILPDDIVEKLIGNYPQRLAQSI